MPEVVKKLPTAKNISRDITRYCLYPQHNITKTKYCFTSSHISFNKTTNTYLKNGSHICSKHISRTFPQKYTEGNGYLQFDETYTSILGTFKYIFILTTNTYTPDHIGDVDKIPLLDK